MVGKINQNKLGFSLLEMSIVIVIISILMAIIVKGQIFIDKARIASAQSLTKSSPINRMKNLIIWYESTMDESFDESDINSGSINNWYNLNPSNKRSNNAAAGSAPTYVANSMNGLPSLLFSSNYLTFDGTDLPYNDYSAIIVEQRNSTGSNNYFIGGTNCTTDQCLVLGYRNNTTMTFGQYGNDYDAAVDGFLNIVPKIHIFRYSSDIGKNYYLNGSQLIDETSGNALNGLTIYSDAQIARRDSSLYYSGYIGEIIIIKRYIDDDERKDIEKYLSKKWKIEIS